MNRRRIALLVVAATLPGCGNGDVEPSPAPTPSPEIAESFEDRLPEGFPQGFPLPEDHRVLYSQAAGAVGWVVYFDSGLPRAELVSFFAERLPATDWTIVNCVTSERTPEPISVFAASKGQLSASVTIGHVESEQVPFEGPFKFLVVIAQTPSALPTPTGPPPEC